jgi:uncharacterized protein with HEPN domain
MREPSRDPGRIQDILEAANNVLEFTRGVDFEQFRQDKLLYFATLKNIEIIGEAAFMITEEYRMAHPEIPWDGMIRMRHVLVHGYASILPELLWETVEEDIPYLLSQLKQKA